MIAAAEDPYWKLPPHPHDILVRNFGKTLSPRRCVLVRIFDSQSQNPQFFVLSQL